MFRKFLYSSYQSNDNKTKYYYKIFNNTVSNELLFEYI